jgi:gamma-glutamyltranspeptidase
VYPHESSDVLLLESRVEGHVLEELKRRGHKIATVGPFEDACMASIILRQPTGVLLCGADQRHDGWAGVI